MRLVETPATILHQPTTGSTASGNRSAILLSSLFHRLVSPGQLPEGHVLQVLQRVLRVGRRQQYGRVYGSYLKMAAPTVGVAGLGYGGCSWCGGSYGVDAQFVLCTPLRLCRLRASTMVL